MKELFSHNLSIRVSIAYSETLQKSKLKVADFKRLSTGILLQKETISLSVILGLHEKSKLIFSRFYANIKYDNIFSAKFILYL